MNVNVIGNWKAKKTKLMSKYANITDEDLCYTEGKEKEMVEKLGAKIGKSSHELLYIIAAL